jgi:hypothetical protein
VFFKSRERELVQLCVQHCSALSAIKRHQCNMQRECVFCFVGDWENKDCTIVCYCEGELWTV